MVGPPAATPGRGEAWPPERVLAVRAAMPGFALPKGRKVRDVPLPSSVARDIQRHTEPFAPLPVTLPWDDPRPSETPMEAEHRRPRVFNLLVTGRRRSAIDRKSFNTYV
jgi:hypothetical protein